MSQLPINSEPPKERSTNELAADRTELAKYRSRAAADRTLMAWIRTSLSLIGFGFGIPTIVRTLEQTHLHPKIDPVRFSVIVGLSFIGTGMLGMALGLREHRHLLQQIESDRYTYETSYSTEIVGVALLVIGFVSFIGVIVKSLIF